MLFLQAAIPVLLPIGRPDGDALDGLFFGSSRTGREGRGWTRYPLEYLRWAGVVSYSAYLVHLPLLHLMPHYSSVIFHRKFKGLDEYGLYLCSWLPILVFSFVFYRCVELPSIALGKWFLKQVWKEKMGAGLFSVDASEVVG